MLQRARTKLWAVLATGQELTLYEVTRGTQVLAHARAASFPGTVAWAESVASLLTEQRYAGEGLLLLVGGEHVLSAPVTLQHRAMQRDPQMLAFALEEQLPVAVEDLACEFLVHKGQALGVAVLAAAWRESLDHLASHDIQVLGLVPAEILIWQVLPPGALPKSGLLLVMLGDKCSVLSLQDKKPVLWRVTEGKPAAIVRELRLLLESTPEDERQVVGVGVSELLGQLLQSSGTVGQLQLLESSVQEHLARGASGVAQGRLQPEIDLLQAGLGSSLGQQRARRQRRWVGVGVAGMLIGAALGLLIRGVQYSQLAARSDQAQQTVFRRTFPEKRVPAAIRSRLQSELESLAGVTGQRENLPALPSAKAQVLAVLGAVPRELRVRINELVAGESGVRLEVELQRHTDAEVLVSSLRSQGFVVPPPRSENLAGEGVSVTVTAAVPGTPAQTLADKP